MDDSGRRKIHPENHINFAPDCILPSSLSIAAKLVLTRTLEVKFEQENELDRRTGSNQQSLNIFLSKRK